MARCTPVCWTPVPCPVCGGDLPPRGRSVGLEANPPQCCCDARYAPENRRHLWHEHDDARHYTDPLGWAEHVRTCPRCAPDLEE